MIEIASMPFSERKFTVLTANGRQRHVTDHQATKPEVQNAGTPTQSNIPGVCKVYISREMCWVTSVLWQELKKH